MGLIEQHQPEAIAKRLQREPSDVYLAPAILGSIDGCVTTFAIVAGAAGAGFPATVAIVLGAANLFADGTSMAISNFKALSAQRQRHDALRAMEEMHIEQIPGGEREEHDLPRHLAPPIRSSLATFFSFVVAGSVPLIPLAIQSDLSRAFLPSAALAALVFFVPESELSQPAAPQQLWPG